MAWGIISASVKALRIDLKMLADTIAKLTEEVDLSSKAFVELKTKHDALAAEARIGLTGKASKESVDGIKEQLAEIKGMLNTLTMTERRTTPRPRK